MTVADRCLCRCGDPFHLEKGGDLCNVAATYLWLISDEAVIDLRFIADQLQSGFQACANHSAMSAHDSVISQQVRNSSDRLLKWYAKGLNLYCSTSPNQSSVYQHGNNCSILIYSFNCNCPVVRGARWLSGRVSDSGARGRGFETYRRRVVSLSKTLYSPKVLVNYPGSGGSVPTWLKNCWLGR